MHQISEYLHLTNWALVPEEWDGNLICVETDAEMTFRTNETQGFLAAYSFTIVIKGSLTLRYNERELTLRPDDLYIYSPGLPVRILSVSDNYRGICLIADEHYTLEQPSVYNAIRTAYFSIVKLREPSLSLKPGDSRHLQELMRLAIHYLYSNQPLRNNSLRMLYSLFLNDLSAIQEHSIQQQYFPTRVEELFLEFQYLASRHFAEHHDISFYASQLCITNTYLSRIVRQVSGGHTVIDYINQLLLMEASWLLQTTPLTVAQIADRLHFAETTTFANFFRRMKGMTPRQYREQTAGNSL